MRRSANRNASRTSPEQADAVSPAPSGRLGSCRAVTLTSAALKQGHFPMKPALVRHISLSFPSLLNAVKNKPSAVLTSRRKAVATLGLPPKLLWQNGGGQLCATASPRNPSDPPSIWLACSPKTATTFAEIRRQRGRLASRLSLSVRAQFRRPCRSPLIHPRGP